MAFPRAWWWAHFFHLGRQQHVKDLARKGEEAFFLRARSIRRRSMNWSREQDWPITRHIWSSFPMYFSESTTFYIASSLPPSPALPPLSSWLRLIETYGVSWLDMTKDYFNYLSHLCFVCHLFVRWSKFSNVHAFLSSVCRCVWPIILFWSQTALWTYEDQKLSLTPRFS
jgi:hypothetical protein